MTARNLNVDFSKVRMIDLSTMYHFFKLNFYFKIIIDVHALLRANTGRSCAPLTYFPWIVMSYKL